MGNEVGGERAGCSGMGGWTSAELSGILKGLPTYRRPSVPVVTVLAVAARLPVTMGACPAPGPRRALRDAGGALWRALRPRRQRLRATMVAAGVRTARGVCAVRRDRGGRDAGGGCAWYGAGG